MFGKFTFSKILIIAVVVLCLGWFFNFFMGSTPTEKIHSAKTSGLFVKDSLEVHAFDDPDVPGVVCYYTLPKRSLSFEDQTDTSLSCRQVGPITGEIESERHIMKASKNWMFKNLRMDRVYDEKRNVIVYVTYTTKMEGDNAGNSISVVPIRPW